jgi:signal transduction histidine kinase/ligand-binding sensor domain-containing protein/DNA-binding response OmpR family regulator
MIKRIFLLFLLHGLPLLMIRAQAPLSQYQFTRIDITHGLSANQVNAILKDSQGFMWFGTMSGLNRYDGYTFKVFRQDLRDSTSLSDNFITKLAEGPEGLIWITNHNGQNVYNPATGNFERQPQKILSKWGITADSINNIVKDRQGNFWFITPKAIYHYSTTAKKATRVPVNPVAAMVQDTSGNFWLLHPDGVLERMNERNHAITYRTHMPAQPGSSLLQNYEMTADTDGDLWIFSNSDVQGIYYFNINKGFIHYDQNSPSLRLNNNIVRGVVQDNQGLIWIGTDHGGMNVIDKRHQTIQYLVNNSENGKSLSQNSINALYRDNSGIIWIGTYKRGLSYYHENIVKFPLYQHQLFAANSLPFDDVNRFAEDAGHNLWIGTNGGGLIYFDRSRNTWKQYLHDAGNGNSPSSNVIVSLWIDHSGKLWIGSYFGGLDCYDGNRFIHYKHDPANPASLSDNSVWEIFEDSRQQLWIGTLTGGLNLLDRNSGQFQHFSKAVPNTLRADYVSAILEDKQHNLWIGTSVGLDVRDSKGHFTHYDSEISNRNVICLFEDSRGMIWVGTQEGLNLFDPRTKKFRIFRREDGLPDNTVLNILEDNDHTLWMSTANGLSNMNEQYQFKNYDESDGLQGREFNENAALKTSRGELIFGGGNGFNLFYPHTIAVNHNVPPVVLTDFQVFNKSMSPGEVMNGRVLLSNTISHTKEITLKYRENVFSVSFAALNYFHPEKNQYMYMLEGFNNEWLTTDGQLRMATYTNLDPGDYTFRVKASNNDGVWTQQPLELHIKILPPFWRTPLAFILYILTILGALWLARRLILERERLRTRIEQERQEAQHMHELDTLKIRFFTNISHEFRTPLSLIITPLEKIIKKDLESGLQQQLVLVQRNARRLLNLVNQLLDFRKMEVQEIKLYPVQGDVVSFVKELTTSFSDLSEKKQIHLDFYSNVGTLSMLYDPDKIEKIIFNLLSNAFKFTPEQGNISVDLQLQSPESLAIMVKDTGIGIPPEQQERIFESFFQHDIPGSLVNQGSGIGLSITREFVKLHGGSISVDSAPGMGSCFTILLPVMAVEDQPMLTDAVKTTIMTAKPVPVRTEYTGKKPVILLIEDSEDFRFYLKDNLGLHFHIIDAADGLAGWNILQHTIPNLVVSDVNMPEMDGLELCRRIRQQPRIAHLPVILLTARAGEEDQLEALDNGATDYITKPFNYEMLLSRIRNIISQQVSLKNTFKQHIDAHPEEIAISSHDEQFIQNALRIVEKNISNPDFSVEELSRELHMSRVSAYKKLLQLTGKPPIEFIRSIRLKRAAQLLEKSQMTIAEVAYEVGFNNPKYFSKYFKLEYNVLPSAYRGKTE